MDFSTYREIRVKELVDETMKTVFNAACYDDEGTQKDYDEVVKVTLEETEEDSEDEEFSDSCLSLEVHDMARAHWIQLHKLNQQSAIIQNALLFIVENYKHVRPIWQFGLRIDESSKDWKSTLFNDFYFRHHCASIQAAFTMIMENMDEEESMRKLLNEIGAHHFFYDACEPHLELFEQAMIYSLRTTLVGEHKIDDETEMSWRLFLKDVKTYMAEGIAIQRNTYLRQCITMSEIDEIRNKWEKIVEFGLQEAGEIVCDNAIKSYTMLIGTHSLRLTIPFRKSSEVFSRFAEMIMKAFDVAIKSHSETIGFCNLVKDIREFVVTCMVLEMCPSFARKAMMDGLFTMLERVFGPSELSELTMRTWSKLYRALEQAIIANIVDY